MWHVRDGATVLGTLQEWAKRAGWHVYAVTPNTYTIHGSMDFPGDFAQAAVDFVNSVHADVPPYAHLHTRSLTLVLTDSDHNSISFGGTD
jgi:hypothetical protein